MTLQRRVTWALVLLVALFTVVQGGLAVWSMHEQEDDLVDDLVHTESRRLAQQIERQPPGSAALLLLPDHYEAWWLAADGQGYPTAPPPELTRLTDGPHRDTTAGREWHVLVMPAAGGRLFVRYDAERNEQKVHDFAWQVALLALVFVALAAVLARHIATRLVQPLERLARLMDHWAPDPGTTPASERDEEGRLLDAFARVQTRWEHALAREGEMLADLRHELRTPLAALRTDIELLLPGAADDSRPRLTRALAAIDTMAGTLASLHRPAMAEPGAGHPVPLAECTADAWASLGELPAARGLVLANQVDPRHRVQADRHALMTILRNLMRNAAEHAAPARLRVQVHEGLLVIEDDGPGIEADELPFVFERYYRGRLADAPQNSDLSAPHRGLGLAIARRVAESSGWRLGVRAAVPRGTRFELDFTPGA